MQGPALKVVSHTYSLPIILLHKNAMKVKTSGFYFIQKACFILKINDIHHACSYPPLEIKEYKKITLTKTYICDVIKWL